MSMIGAVVRSAAFGEGVIRERTETTVTIDFGHAIKRFPYPEGFERHLVACEAQIQAEILTEIEQKRQEQTRRKLAQAAEEQREQQTRMMAQAQTSERTGDARATGKRISPVQQAQRVAGVPSPFFVFQGATYAKESNGGYIWAPRYNAAGHKMHFWERLTQLQKDDILFHSCDGEIKAVSTANDRCYDAEQPHDLTDEALWELRGRRVDCTYHRLQTPLALATFRDALIRIRFDRYNAFSANGMGTQGYLFELPNPLAAIFLRNIAATNPSIHSVEAVQAFLEYNA